MDIDTTMISETKQHDATSRIIKQSGLGLRLKTARESMRITEKDAATRLHLNPKIISIIENEQFENGPPETFIRGYIRSYARLLSIPDAEIHEALTQLQPPIPVMAPVTTAVTKKRPPYSSHRYLRLMTYVVIAMLVVLVSIWWTSHPKDILSNTKTAAPINNAVTILSAPPELSHVAPVTPAKPVNTTQHAVQTTSPMSVSTVPKQTVKQEAKPITPTAAPTPHNAPMKAESPVVATVTVVPPNAKAPTNTTQATPPPIETKPAKENLDDMDMSLSDPGLSQGDDHNEPNQENDTKYNNTN